MNSDEHFGLQFENFKSFGAGLFGFESIRPINLIIGRNNSGKSALLDLVEFACDPKPIPAHLHHNKAAPRIVMTTAVQERPLRAAFQQGSSGGPIRGNHWEVGKQLLGARISVELLSSDAPNLLSIDREIPQNQLIGDATPLFRNLGAFTKGPLHGRIFHRLAAERDIAIETVSAAPHIDKNGRGFTSTVSQLLNRFEHPTELVADILLDAINQVFAPDASFSSIDVQQHGDNGPWEVFLNESGKGRVGLTHSGSGIKTILLAASSFLLLPYIHKKPLSDFVFAFEELENNLHPALQRRLLRYIADFAKREGTLLFITTHSNVVIDLFSNERDAQILHVTQTAGKSSARRVQTYVENRGVLDDLDIRASDLLQANGIVWLEGPSDRLYFNRWIEVASDGTLKEGAHYQCVFYGGRLLAHLSADDPDVSTEDVVKILRVNRNAVILIDSDKQGPRVELNNTKKRIVSEIEAIEGMAWVTAGREVENYLPLPAIQSMFRAANSAPSQFDDFAEYLDSLEMGAGKRFLRNKVMFAESVTSAITKTSIVDVLDLSVQLNQALAVIKKWNGMA